MEYSEEFKQKLLINEKVLIGAGCNLDEIIERLNCNDPFIGRIIDHARMYARKEGLDAPHLDDLYNEWENAFFDPKNTDWATSFPYQKTKQKHK